MGLLDHETGEVRVKHVPNVQRRKLQERFARNVEAGCEVITDEWMDYHGLDPVYAHNVINHAEAYVKGHVHTNRIENFW